MRPRRCRSTPAGALARQISYRQISTRSTREGARLAHLPDRRRRSVAARVRQMWKQSSRHEQHHCASASAEPERPPGVTCIEGGGNVIGQQPNPTRTSPSKRASSAPYAHARPQLHPPDQSRRTEPSSSCRASLLSEQPRSAATIGSASFAPRSRRGDRHRDVALLRGQHRGQHRRRRRQIARR